MHCSPHLRIVMRISNGSTHYYYRSTIVNYQVKDRIPGYASTRGWFFSVSPEGGKRMAGPIQKLKKNLITWKGLNVFKDALWVALIFMVVLNWDL